MKVPVISAWAALDQSWLYLGRPLQGGFEIATLTAVGQRIAPVFTNPEGAASFLDAAPHDLELLVVEADDLRAKEEWLRAVTAQGAVDLAFDPDPATLHPSAALRVDKALWYVLSQRRATACL